MAPPEEPMVDVGIPTLGARPFLTEAVESVFAQTHSNWRLVISENGPGTDEARRVLEPYLSDPRVSHVVTGEQVGIGANHTNLFRLGNAPYLGVLHDDDRWHPGFLERRVAFLEQNRTCGFVYSGHVVIDDSGRPLGRTRLRLSPGLHTSAASLSKLCRTNFIGVPTVLVRRTAYEAVGARYREIPPCDWDMCVRLSAKFDVGVTPAWDADYRVHANQMSAARTSLADTHLSVLDSLEDVPLPRSLRRLMYAESYARCALDAVERGDRRVSLQHLLRAVRSDPLSVVRPIQAARILATVGVLVGGSRVRDALAVRRERYWRDAGFHGLMEMSEDAK
jgi:glycosyltransferase involved in cell wall biosynthesis